VRRFSPVLRMRFWVMAWWMGRVMSSMSALIDLAISLTETPSGWVSVLF